jgi:hydroxyacid-oxoacid transhydrogenase
MSCCHEHYAATPEGDRGFEVDSSRVRFGRGLLDESGDAARGLGMRRVALFTDPLLARLPFLETVRASLRRAGLDVVEYDGVSVEPTDASFQDAAAFAVEGKFDGYVSVGGGSTIDTAKAANLFATYPADFMAYVNAPIGQGLPVPGPLAPHIACPTTSGTGSECTGIAIFDFLAMEAKTGIVSRRLKPSLGIIDPDVARSLPSGVVACSGFDVLSHALESYTALPYTRRKRAANAELRPLSQGANPFSDIACLEALRILGRNIERAVRDPDDDEAREQMMFAAMLAGIGFGNAGCHAPHGMSYSVSGLVRDFHPSGYPPGDSIVPHGMSVIVNAPAVFRFTAPACPGRHPIAAAALGADVAGVAESDAGAVLAERIVGLMRTTGIPNGLSGLGYSKSDATALVDGAFPQRRLFSNSPRDITRDDLRDLFHSALTYW